MSMYPQQIFNRRSDALGTVYIVFFELNLCTWSIVHRIQNLFELWVFQTSSYASSLTGTQQF